MDMELDIEGTEARGNSGIEDRQILGAQSCCVAQDSLNL